MLTSHVACIEYYLASILLLLYLIFCSISCSILLLLFTLLFSLLFSLLFFRLSLSSQNPGRNDYAGVGHLT